MSQAVFAIHNYISHIGRSFWRLGEVSEHIHFSIQPFMNTSMFIEEWIQESSHQENCRSVGDLRNHAVGFQKTEAEQKSQECLYALCSKCTLALNPRRDGLSSFSKG